MHKIYEDKYVELYYSDGMFWMHLAGDPYTTPGWPSIVEAIESLENAERALQVWRKPDE